MTILLMSLIGCTKFDALNALVPPFGYHRTRDVAYGPLPRQKLDVYQPTSSTRPADIVVFFYGGSWQNGEKSDYIFAAQALTSKGFIAVLPDYRLYPAARFPAFVQDGALAIKWAHDHAKEIGGDPRRVFLIGHSAGAHIAALLTLDGRYLHEVGLDRSAVAGTVALAGPYDFVPSSGDRRVLLMQDGDTKPPVQTQPIAFVDGREPPMLLIHGTADETVSVDNTKALADKIRQAGGSVETRIYDGKTHVGVVLSLAWPFRWIAPTLRDSADYIRALPTRSPNEKAPAKPGLP